MANPVVGVGYLLANDILTDAAYFLVEPSVNAVVPTGGIAAGAQTVDVWDLAMYVGAQILVGTVGGDLEVVTITATNPGTSFTATFANNHTAGEPIVGATFPVRQTTDPFFTQGEMIAYLSTACNDFLLAVPLVYNVADVTVPFAAQNAPLPSDCMVPARIAYQSYPLRETSQANLDAWDYRWQQQAASQPYCYFRDKIPIQNFGIFPRANNSVPVEIVYQQRQAQTMGLGDGFLIPDPFLTFVLFRVLSFAYSKDGEASNPALAKYYAGRYEMGVKISNMFLGAILDSNLEMAQ
jgi:hypothetical protein